MVTAILGILVALSQSLLMLKFWPVLAVILVILALFIGLGKDDGMVAKAVAGPEGAKTDPQRSTPGVSPTSGSCSLCCSARLPR